MKIIEAMKKVKANKEKINDLQILIGKHCANLNYENPPYGETTKDKINEWLQSCTDLSQDNAKLLVAIARTNLATTVIVNIGGKLVSKNIAEWIWRRREYAALDFKTWAQLTDRSLKEGSTATSVGEPMKITIVRHFNPEQRDVHLAMYKSEAHEIDAALEVVNAITDLVEHH